MLPLFLPIGNLQPAGFLVLLRIKYGATFSYATVDDYRVTLI
jgi:hypothetical protein